MGIMDAFEKEHRIEITVSKLYDLVKEAARADLFRNGVKNNVPYEYILQVIDGNAYAMERNQPIWHNVKTDPPKEPGIYWGKNYTNLWTCYFGDGKWVLNKYRDQPALITHWCEYAALNPVDEA